MPAPLAPRPSRWPYRADPPGRYWDAYHVYQSRGGQVRLEDDIRGFVSGGENEGDISRFYFFNFSFDQLMKEGVRGDIAELGAYKGNTATILATMARRMGSTAWILDTFEGFKPADFVGPDARQKVQFTDTSLDAVRALVGEQNVRYVKGYFPESASQMPDDLGFALVHIDCDLYLPILHALEYFYPRLLPGGYLIVHDYASLAWEGAPQAVDEFFLDKPEPIIPLTDGGGSAVIRKMRIGSPKQNWLISKRQKLVSTEWTSAGDGGLADLLGSGWSGSEPWGVWGIGPSHFMTLYLTALPGADFVVHFKTGAVLVGTRDQQEVEVLVAGVKTDRWIFTMTANQGERSVTVPAALVTNGPNGPVVELEFRPSSVVPVNELDVRNKDDRALGLAIMGMRVSLG